MNFLKIGGQQRSTKGIEYFNSEDYYVNITILLQERFLKGIFPKP